MSAVTSIYYIPLTAMALDNEAMGYEYDYSSEETAFRTTVRTSVRSLQVVPVRWLRRVWWSMRCRRPTRIESAAEVESVVAWLPSFCPHRDEAPDRELSPCSCDDRARCTFDSTTSWQKSGVKSRFWPVGSGGRRPGENFFIFLHRSVRKWYDSSHFRANERGGPGDSGLRPAAMSSRILRHPMRWRSQAGEGSAWCRCRVRFGLVCVAI